MSAAELWPILSERVENGPNFLQITFSPLILFNSVQIKVILEVALEGKNLLVLEKASRAHKIALITAKEGLDTAQRVFNPELLHAGMKEEETMMLEKICKDIAMEPATDYVS